MCLVQVREAHFYYLVFILLTEGLREGGKAREDVGRGDGSRSALKFLERNRGRPQRRTVMCTVRGGHGAARCPREPRLNTGGFERGAH